MIRLADVRFQYRRGDFAFCVPELDVRRGERVAVVGPSGSGKTTLLHMVAGITAPDAGRVETCGVRLDALDDAKRRAFRVRRIGLVFQEFELLGYLSVRDNILLPYLMSPALALDTATRARADALARRVGIAEKLGQRARQLSHGEKQRAALCRALVTEPELLLADEPTGNLDPANRDRVRDLLVEDAERRGATLVVVTHDRELLPAFARVLDVERFREAPA